MTGHHGLWGKGPASTPQNFYEEAVRIPYLMRWPGVFPENNRLSIPFDHCDMFATLVAATGLQLSDGLRTRINTPGQNLRSYLDGDGFPWRAHQFCNTDLPRWSPTSITSSLSGIHPTGHAIPTSCSISAATQGGYKSYRSYLADHQDRGTRANSRRAFSPVRTTGPLRAQHPQPAALQRQRQLVAERNARHIVRPGRERRPRAAPSKYLDLYSLWGSC